MNLRKQRKEVDTLCRREEDIQTFILSLEEHMDVNILSFKKVVGACLVIVATAFCLALLINDTANAAYEFNDTLIGKRVLVSAYLKNNTVWRAFREPNELMQFKWEARLEIDSQVNEHIGYHLEGNFWYDAVFDVTTRGVSNVHGASKYLRTNGDLPYDDYLREAYIDLKIPNYFVRLGKQQVVWGKSDGLRLLDIVNPFNWSDWTMAEFEESRIPVWMARAEREFPSIWGNLQLLWIGQYVNSIVAPAYTPWSFRAVDIFQGMSDDAGAFVFDPDLWYSRTGSSPNTIALNKSSWGARWSQQIGQFQYTLNWLRKWSDYVYARPDYARADEDGNPFLYSMKGKRYTVLGTSFDYNWDKILGLENVVMRGEFAYYQDDMSYGAFADDLDPVHYYDHLDYVLGLDKYFFGDWWFSVQFFQVIITDWDRDDVLTNFGLDKRDHVENAATLFVMKDFDMLPGSAECLLYYNDDNVWWIRPRVNYELIRNRVTAAVTANIFWGDHSDFIGNFYKNDMLRLELKYMF